MKRIITLAVTVICAALVSVGAGASGRVADGSHKEIAIVEFKDQVKLLNVFLKGQYLIVHDHEKMARGEDCTYVYSRTPGEADKLVVSFHCIPAERQKADTFKVVTSSRRTQGMVAEVTEIQFAGSSEARTVPISR